MDQAPVIPADRYEQSRIEEQLDVDEVLHEKYVKQKKLFQRITVLIAECLASAAGVF